MRRLYVSYLLNQNTSTGEGALWQILILITMEGFLRRDQPGPQTWEEVVALEDTHNVRIVSTRPTRIVRGGGVEEGGGRVPLCGPCVSSMHMC